MRVESPNERFSFTDTLEKDLSLERLHTIFPKIALIWLVPDVEDLEDDFEELEKVVPNLETSEIKFMQIVMKQQKKQKGEKGTDYEKALRPTHRLKALIGHKVDLIGYYRNQMKELLPKIQSAPRSHLAGKEKLASACSSNSTPWQPRSKPLMTTTTADRLRLHLVK
jgi:hypothetical protein